MRRAAALACIAGVVGGCAHDHRVVISGYGVHQSLYQLRQSGSAEVDAVVDGVDSNEKRHVTLRFDEAIEVDGVPRVISDLARTCSDTPAFDQDTVASGAPAETCELVRRRDELFVVDRFSTRGLPAGADTALGVVVLGALVGVIGCATACHDGTVKTDAEYAAATLAIGLVGALGWLVVSCLGHHGSCRD